jgi:hypothetical protein
MKQHLREKSEDRDTEGSNQNVKRPKHATAAAAATMNHQHPRADQIFVMDHVLSHDECQELIGIHRGHAHAGYMHHLTITRFADVCRERNHRATIASVLPLARARHLCWQHVEDRWDACLELYPECTALMGWHPGSVLQTHHDSNREYLQDRHYSAILYLNDAAAAADGAAGGCETEKDDHDDDDPASMGDSFVGGDLVFEFGDDSATENEPDHCSGIDTDGTGTTTLRIPPKAGRMVCFPSTADYRHRVEQVTRGTRYTFVMWFTRNESAMETLDSVMSQLSWILAQPSPLSTLPTMDRHHLRSVPTSTNVEQPWETPAQAKEILWSTMTAAKMQWTEETQSWGLPVLLLQQADGQKDDAGTSSALLKYLGDAPNATLLLPLIAFCWWRRKKAMGLLHPDDFRLLVEEWEAYIHCRFGGLQKAAKRWKDHGMINNVTDAEFYPSHDRSEAV